MPRQRGGLVDFYPLWGGVAVFVALAVLWPRAPAPEAPADASVPADAVVAPKRAPAGRRLQWRISGRAMPPPAELQACLGSLGYGRALVSGLAADYGIQWPTPPLLQTLRLEEGALRLSTPTEGSCHLAAGLHVATAACLKAPGASLRDPATDRSWTPKQWPAPSAGGGLPVEALVKVVDGQTRGLASFGLPELAGAETKLLLAAAGAGIVACKAEAAARSLEEARSRPPARPKVSLPKPARPVRPKSRPKPATPLPRPKPATPLPRPKPATKPKPSFMPEYRE